MLPLPPGTHFKISQGAFGCCTHNTTGDQYAWDFNVPFGTQVLAVEDGSVIQVWEPNVAGGCDRKYNDQAHNIKILQNDGTVAQYVHVQSQVHIGDTVKKGDVLAVTANNGFICTPQLHFNIFQDRAHIPENGTAETIPVLFEGLPEGGMAHEGLEGFAPPLVDIKLVKDTPRAELTKETLQKLLIQYDLTPYIFTKHVQIEPMVIPHSDPILTLNTRNADVPNEVLTAFVHEEIHWFLDQNEKETNDAIQNLKAIFPWVPSGGTVGAQSIYSSYLHLIVCWLELQADKRYVGDKRAYDLINAQDHYTWIYKQVVASEGEIGVVVKKYGLIIGEQSPRVTLRHVKGNIYVAEDSFFFPENTVVYIGDKSVTVLSATWTPVTAKLLVDAIRDVTDKPITAVVDTHYHLDRVGGNSYFKKLGAKIIASKRTNKLMKEKWNHMVKAAQKDYAGYPDVPLVLPDITFGDHYELEGGKIQLLYLGPSHTEDNVMVYFPDDKVLDGDCVLKEHLGYLGDANLKEYPNTLMRLKKLSIETIIAGHWSAIHGPDLIDKVLELLKKPPPLSRGGGKLY